MVAPNRKNIIACIDGSAYSPAVCDYAAWISARLNAPLELFHNIEHPREQMRADYSGAIGLGSREALLQELTELEERRSRLLIEQGELMLENARVRAVAAGAKEVTCKQRHGNLAESLVDLEEDTRVLVLGLRGQDHADEQGPIGAQLESAVRAVHRPILVVTNDFKEPKRAMLAYAEDEASEKALELQVQSPLCQGMEIHLVSVSDSVDQMRRQQEVAAERLREVGHQVVTAVLSGRRSEQLRRYQLEQGIDLTLMGGFGHTRLRNMLMGSLTAKMLQAADHPLLLLR